MLEVKGRLRKVTRVTGVTVKGIDGRKSHASLEIPVQRPATRSLAGGGLSSGRAFPLIDAPGSQCASTCTSASIAMRRSSDKHYAFQLFNGGLELARGMQFAKWLAV